MNQSFFKTFIQLNSLALSFDTVIIITSRCQSQSLDIHVNHWVHKQRWTIQYNKGTDHAIWHPPKTAIYKPFFLLHM